MATKTRTLDVALATNGVGPDGRPQRMPLAVAPDGSAVAYSDAYD